MIRFRLYAFHNIVVLLRAYEVHYRKYKIDVSDLHGEVASYLTLTPKCLSFCIVIFTDSYMTSPPKCIMKRPK